MAIYHLTVRLEELSTQYAISQAQTLKNDQRVGEAYGRHWYFIATYLDPSVWNGDCGYIWCKFAWFHRVWLIINSEMPKAQQDRGKRNVSRYHWCVPRHAWSSQNTHPHIIVTHSDMVSQKVHPKSNSHTPKPLAYATSYTTSLSVIQWLDGWMPPFRGGWTSLVHNDNHPTTTSSHYPSNSVAWFIMIYPPTIHQCAPLDNAHSIRWI